MTPDLLHYRQEMAGLVHEARQGSAITGVTRPRLLPVEPREIAGLSMPGLLRPPRIETLYPSLQLLDGRLSGILQIQTSDEFGIVYVYVTLRDEQGDLIEDDYAMRNPIYEDHWGYMPSAPLPFGGRVIAQVIASDSLGATGVRTVSITVE
jgi:hypothetical protein